MQNALSQFIKPKKRQRKGLEKPNPRGHGTPYSSERSATRRPLIDEAMPPLESFLVKHIRSRESA